ncbi:hypothetical protein PVAND_010315 [Polypedilum vanderplanki]|uniref:Uncharacterized protein n=1 Tax=Polypedilum vanderplanki TaxID=319348 RepID=A0A9J6CF70_POLVA|nr:hypothetical protein PVAND_010315 [Polypedilum vanderplanki]
MSLCPYFNMDPTSFFDDALEPRFGVPLLPSDFHSERIVPRLHRNHHLPTGYRRPWALSHHIQSKDSAAKDLKMMHFTKDGFQAAVDVHHLS